MNGNNNAYHISNQVAPTTNDQSKNNNSSNTINNNEINVPPPPNNPQAKNDLMNNYWNNTMSGNEFGYQSSFQQPQSNSQISRSPVELAYATPPILCDSQPQNANADSHNRDIFVRSDSILTDDDYVPFDAPAQSKFGPISRMSAKTTQYSTGK